MTRGSLVLAFAGLVGALPLRAQDTLRLGQLQETATRRDPRTAQLSLLETQAELRLQNLATERLPQLSLSGEAAHQSDVTALSFPLGSGAQPPQPPKDRWQTVLGAQQVLYDGGSVARRQAVERARLAESREAVRTVQYRLRAEVSTAFFSAFLLQERSAELASLLGDLEARLGVVRARVREGAALPGDTAAIVAEILRTQQNQLEAAASRRASLAVLGRLVGDTINERDVLALPDLAAQVAEARRAGNARALRQRPEFAQFQRTRDRIARESALANIDRRPRVSAFGQAGYGRPGLNQFNTEPDEFWQAGLRVEWRVWDWGTTARQQQALRAQERIVDADEAAFAEGLDRSVESDLADMSRLEAVLQTDERIITLREQVERQARAQLDEGAITVSDYVEARSDVLEARLAHQRHLAELAQARARYLTTLGVAFP